MPESRDQSPGEDYFNDLSQQLPSNPTTNGVCTADSDLVIEPQGENITAANGQVPKPKRIACVLCRKRKLKCDGNKPACGTCARLQHDCSYDEVRRKSGPKRGYVKALEARLAQVETMLKTQDDHTAGKNDTLSTGASTTTNRATNGAISSDYAADLTIGNGHGEGVPQLQQTHSQHDYSAQVPHQHRVSGAMNVSMGATTGGASPQDPFPWEMIGLGLEEPLPNQDVINELNQVYFEKIHPSMAMIHRPRYYAAMNLAPHMRPPVCLRYAMWCNAAGATDKYEGLQEHFYQRARKYAQQDEMKGHGESMITISHCQAWVLLATYEFKLMYFPRAWVSAGRACKLAQMMGLHRLDGNGLDVKQCLPPPKDWTEREERRRTFWMSFCVDRYSSIGTGWPMTIEERDVMSDLPSSEEAFDLSRPMKAMELADALKPEGPPNLSGFSGVVVMACLFGRNLTHLHRPSPDDNDDDLNGEFWKRHREMDNVLLNTSLSLPPSLRLPMGLNNPNIVFMNMNVHTSTICLHQAAIFKADKNRMPSRISAESKVRCITAAAEIASIMRQVSHVDLSGMNPFISFCLYVAARVFVQYLKSRPSDAQVRASLQFLLQAMHAIKRRNPLTESFLVQLDVDLEGAGLDGSNSLRAQIPRKVNIANQEAGCPMHGHDGTGTDLHVSYGEPGLALYIRSDQAPGDPGGKTSDSASLGFGTDISDPAALAGVVTNQLNLPNRQRTPGSAPGSTSYKSPNGFSVEMDTSPDGSGGDQQTPGSNSQLHSSSHTSNSAYSPQRDLPSDALSQDPSRLAAMFDPADPGFTTDFDMNSFPASGVDNQQAGYVLPHTWASENAPQSAPVTALGVHNTELMGMSEAEWSQVLETFNGWETGLTDDHTPHHVAFSRRS